MEIKIFWKQWPFKYSSAPVSVGDTFLDLLRLCETTDNTQRYI
jgi:hypothetical protein